MILLFGKKAENDGYITIGKDNIYYDELRTIKKGELINFLLTTMYANCDFSMTYYKAGTYNYDSEKGKLANVTKINNFLYDIDVPRENINKSNKMEDKFLQGNEGIQISENNSIDGFYYCTNASQGNYPRYKFSASDRALSVTWREGQGNGVYYKTSAFVTSNLNNGTYSFTYGGSICGITFSFMSPAPYEITAPTKSADVSSTDKTSNIPKLYEGETFKYRVTQYIPNNYYANLIKFSEIYNNFSENGHYSKIVITDELNENLTINGDIKIFNEVNVDKSEYFNIEITGNKITATLKDEAKNMQEFYAHTYTMEIPTFVKKGTGLKLDETEIGISNVAKVITSIDEEENEMDSNEMEIALKYKVTTKIQNGEFITPSAEVDIHGNMSVEFKPKKGYITTSLKIDGVEITDLSDYIDGGMVLFENIVENHDVEVVCSREMGDLVVKYVNENGIEIAEREILKGNVGEEYKTQIKEIKNYEYKDVNGSPNGTYKRESQEVVYNYTEKNKSQVLVKYEDITTHESVKESIIINGYVGDKYETEVDKKIEGYDYVEEMTPENANGVITDSTITVTYYYKKKTSVITKFVDMSTGKEIADQVIQNGYVEDEYETKQIKIEGYDYTEEIPENASGKMKSDIIVVTYYYKKRSKVVIKYIDKSTDKEIADQVIQNGYVGDEYEAKQIEIEGYEFVERTENSKGIMTEEQITVNLYYKKIQKQEPKQEILKELPNAGNEKNIFVLAILGCIIISFTCYKVNKTI